MPNMMDYIAWRGDLPVAAAPWRDVDSLILASFCYNDLGEHAQSAAGIPLRELAPMLTLREQTGGLFFRQWRDLLYAMAETQRFGSMGVHDYVDDIDPSRGMQFSAVTCDLDDGSAVIAFRGTDNTIVGWREDFDMSYESPVPAQTEAAAYLLRIAAQSDRPLWVTGHSKGGNLAAYATAHAPEEVQARLLGVYSFDGPGLDDGTMASDGYERIRGRVHSLIPQSSVVGLLLSYHPDYTVVRARALSLLQHDAFTWQLDGPRFVALQQVDIASQLTNRTVHEWLKHCPPEQRRRFVDTMFSLLEATHASTLNELNADRLKTASALLAATRALDAESRRMVRTMVGQLMTIGAANAWEMITDKPLPRLREHNAKEVENHG